jgi:hypothetical protein
MSKGGASITAPPIFIWQSFSQSYDEMDWRKWCIICDQSLMVTNDDHENTSPSRGIGCVDAALSPTRTPLRFHRARGASSRCLVTSEEKENGQEEEAKDLEEPPQQTSRKTGLVHYFRPGSAILLNGVGKTANREIGVPGKNQNGEPGGSPFQRFNFRRRGVI